MQSKMDRSAAGVPAADIVLVGKFGAPQGVRGEIRIRSYTDDPMAIASYGELSDATGTRRFRIVSARPLKDSMLVARIEGVGERSLAETLTNIDLYVPRARLPAPDEDEYYHADLIGLEARLADGLAYGRIVRIENYGAGDILEILRPDGDEAMIAFTRANVPTVDIRGGFVVVVPPQEIEARDTRDD